MKKFVIVILVFTLASCATYSPLISFCRLFIIQQRWNILNRIKFGKFQV